MATSKPSWSWTARLPNSDGTRPTYYASLDAATAALARIPQDDRAPWCYEVPFQSSPTPEPLWRIARSA